MSKKMAVKEVEFKNYVYAFLTLVIGILIAYYICGWINVKNEEKLLDSYLISSNAISNRIDDINSLNHIMSESPSEYFIYFSYTNDKNIYNFEKKLKKVIDDYGLNEIFYYVDLTSEIENNTNYIEKINNELNINYLKNVPAIIYVNNNEIKESDVLNGIDGTKLKVDDLIKLLDIYKYSKIDK